MNVNLNPLGQTMPFKSANLELFADELCIIYFILMNTTTGGGPGQIVSQLCNEITLKLDGVGVDYNMVEQYLKKKFPDLSYEMGGF